MAICFQNSNYECECKNLNKLCPVKFNKIIKYIQSLPDNIILLKQPTVISWLFNDLKFLNEKNMIKDNKELIKREHIWGQTMLKLKRPDLKKTNQWTTKLGEHVVEELFTILNANPSKPIKKANYCPDLEINNAIIEVKAQTYFTPGTAGEKILGVPLKYADIPSLYSKKLKIICVGQAENLCRTSYGVMGNIKSEHKNKILLYFKEHCDIEFIGITDIIEKLI
jgi:hypothetical protein